MATEPIPMFHGQVTVTAGENDTIDFFETINGDLTANVVPGTYWPDDYIQAIQDALNVALPGFTVTLQVDGKINIGRGSGWYPKITSAEVAKCLTGGDISVDTDLPLEDGRIAPNSAGFTQDTTYPAQATNHVSDQWLGSAFYPDEPPAEDPKFQLKKVVRVATTPRGDMYHADYTGRGRGIEQRTLRFEFQTEPTRNVQADTWWRWYASQGSLIRYYPDRTATAYKVYKLTEESCKDEAFDRQFLGYPFFVGTFTMQRVWDQLESS